MPATPLARAARANTLKQQLIHYLGDECVECGCTDPAELEVNHIYGRDWTPRKVTHYRRVLRYWREAREGLCNCLCRACNSRYIPIPRPVMSTTHAPPNDDSTPF